jgi:hypothetical protein
MNRNTTNKRLDRDKLSILFIMFLMAAIIFFLFMLLSVGKALADPLERGMRLRIMQRTYTNDDLTPEESSKMEKARQDHWQEIAPLRQELGVKKMELKLLSSDGKTEASRIEILRKEIQDLQDRIREKNLNYRLHCQDLLNPEKQDSFPGRRRGGGRGWREP